MAAVATDCPNHDDVCIPGPGNAAICRLRHQILYERKHLQLELGIPIYHPNFQFSEDVEGTGFWGNYSSAYTRSASQVPTTWTCNAAFYGSNDGCDCNCGAWDPDCDVTSPSSQKQKVLNCEIEHPDVRCAMSSNAPSRPVCLYDRLAASAANDAGFPTSDSLSHSTTTVVAASVVSAIVTLVVAAAIAYVIRRRRRALRALAEEQPEVSLRPMNSASSHDIDDIDEAT